MNDRIKEMLRLLLVLEVSPHVKGWKSQLKQNVNCYQKQSKTQWEISHYFLFNLMEVLATK